jgi:hypothetical protein
VLTLGIYRKSLGKSLLYEITIDNNEADVVIEWFEVAILDGLLRSLVEPQTKKHWHLYGKSASHEGGVTMPEAKPTSPPPFLL